MVRRPYAVIKRQNEGVFTNHTPVDTARAEQFDSQCEKLTKQTVGQWTESALSLSIRTVGVLYPVLYLRSELLDGRRRVAIAAAQGLECPALELASELQVARLLWRVHPARAWARFVRRGMPRATIADLFGVELEQLPDRRARWLRRR